MTVNNKLEGILKEEVMELFKVLSRYVLVVAGKNHENFWTVVAPWEFQSNYKSEASPSARYTYIRHQVAFAVGSNTSTVWTIFISHYILGVTIWLVLSGPKYSILIPRSAHNLIAESGQVSHSVWILTHRNWKPWPGSEQYRPTDLRNFKIRMWAIPSHCVSQPLPNTVDTNSIIRSLFSIIYFGHRYWLPSGRKIQIHKEKCYRRWTVFASSSYGVSDLGDWENKKMKQ
jgi:hypothetical protein